MIDADEPMVAEHWTEAETLAVLNGATPETPANFLTYSENFFAHGFQNVRKNSEEMQRILGNLENSAMVGNELAIESTTTTWTTSKMRMSAWTTAILRRKNIRGSASRPVSKNVPIESWRGR